MPTYEYECTKCGELFDYFQSIKEAPKDTCEKCGGKLIKLLSAGTGLIFKGSGFYITDYKNKSGGDGAGKQDGGKVGGGKDGAGSVKSGSSEGSSGASGAASSGDSKGAGSAAAPASASGSNGSGGDKGSKATK